MINSNKFLIIIFTVDILFTSAFAQVPQNLFKTQNLCNPSNIPNCSNEWDNKLETCTIICTANPIPPPTLVRPIKIGGFPTGPATGGVNNQVVLDQINTTIKTGTHAERAQLANWLLTPNISHVLTSEPIPFSEKNLPPDTRKFLEIVREGSVKERAIAGDKMLEFHRK